MGAAAAEAAAAGVLAAVVGGAEVAVAAEMIPTTLADSSSSTSSDDGPASIATGVRVQIWMLRPLGEDSCALAVADVAEFGNRANGRPSDVAGHLPIYYHLIICWIGAVALVAVDYAGCDYSNLTSLSAGAAAVEGRLFVKATDGTVILYYH